MFGRVFPPEHFYLTEPLAKVGIVMRASEIVLRKDEEQNRLKRTDSYVEDDFATKTPRRAFAADRNRLRFLQEAQQ